MDTGHNRGNREAVFVMCGAISPLEGCALVSLRQAAESVGFELSDRALQSLPGRTQL